MNLIFYVCSKLDLVILSFAIQITIIKNKTTANIVGNLYCYIFGLFAAFKLKYWIEIFSSKTNQENWNLICC